MTEMYSPGLEGVVAGVTKIGSVDPERNMLMYRGYDINDLIDQNASFEDVAYLLLYGNLPTRLQLEKFTRELAMDRDLPDVVVDFIKTFPLDANKMDALKAATAAMALYDPDVRADAKGHEANIRKARRLIAKFPSMVAYAYRASQGLPIIKPDASMGHAENFLYMIFGEKPTPLMARIFNAVLVIYAEHGFNASTFTARVCASTESDLYSAIVAAIGALKGPLHGGANEQAMRMLLEVEKSGMSPQAWISDALAKKKKIMGFGHREYKHGDPRAGILTAMGREMAQELGDTQWPSAAEAIAEVMKAEKGLYPNVDYPIGYILYMMKLPLIIYTPIFAVGRIAGWTAHVIEQLGNNRLIRPKAIYEGERGLSFTPPEARV